MSMKELQTTNRFLALLLAVVMMVMTGLGHWTPSVAEAAGEKAGEITLTVIGDTSDHSESDHTGYVYWMKDEPLELSEKAQNGGYVAENCKDQILSLFEDYGIEADNDNSTCYMSEATYNGVTLGFGWSVIVAYADGTFSSDGWGNYSGAAKLKPGCRLIYYWSHDNSSDCRLSTDDNYQTHLNYDTDAVTGLTFYTEDSEDLPVDKLTMAGGDSVELRTKFNVPPTSSVSRKLSWSLDNVSGSAKLEETENGAKITAMQAGSVRVTAQMTNTLGDRIKASCEITITSDYTMPELIPGEVSRDGKTAQVNVTANKEGTLYWIVSEQEATLEEVKGSANQMAVAAGVNTLKLSELGTAKSGVYLALKDSNGYWSSLAKAEIPEGEVITGITLDQTALVMEEGAETNLTAAILPEGAEAGKEITWTSDKPGVAAVTGNGKTAVITAAGKSGETAVITVACGDQSASCKVTVTRVKSLNVTPDSLNEMMIGDKEALTLQVTWENDQKDGTVIEKDAAVWSSDDESVVKVTGNGKTAEVEAVGAGTANVKAEKGGKSAICEVEAMRQPLLLEKLICSMTASSSFYETSEIDADTLECTVYAPEETNMFYVKPVLAAGTGGKTTITANYQNTNNVARSVTLTNNSASSLSQFMKSNNYEERTLTIKVTVGKRTETYKVHVKRLSKLKALALTDDQGAAVSYTPAFAKDTKTYNVSVPANKKSLTFTMTANYYKNKVYTVDGNAAEFTGTGATSKGTYTLPLDGTDKTVTFCAGNESGAVPVEYTLNIKILPVYELTLKTDPEDAVTVIYDSNWNRVLPENGVYTLVGKTTYTYTVGKPGYVSKSGTIVLSQDKAETVSLEKAEETTFEPVDSSWGGYYAGSDNLNVVDAKAPESKNAAEIKWDVVSGTNAQSLDTRSDAILLGNQLCLFHGDKLQLVNKETGEVEKEVTMSDSANSTRIKPLYADGMIFVALRTGNIQAFHAKTLESLWIYQARTFVMPAAAMQYENGLLYISEESDKSGGKLICISTTDEAPEKTDETKVELWSHYMSEGCVTENTVCYLSGEYVITAGNGRNLYCLDKKNGTVAQTVDIGATGNGGVYTGISYANGRIYFVSASGYLNSFKLTPDGLIDESSKQAVRIYTQSTISTYNCALATPLVYNGRIYVGSRGYYTPEDIRKYAPAMTVVEENRENGALRCVYNFETDGKPCSEPTLVKAEDGSLRVYFVTDRGNLYLMRDQAGQTEADYELIYEKPAGDSTYISEGQVLVDADGTLYVRYQNGHMLSIKRSSMYLNNVTVENGNAVMDDGAVFDAQEKEHRVLVDAGTKTLKVTAEANAGTTVSMNGTEGASQEIALKAGEITMIRVELSRDGETRSYVLNVREKSSDAKLSDLRIMYDYSGKKTEMDPTPNFDPEVTEYKVTHYNTMYNTMYLYVEAADPNASVKVTVVSGVRSKKEGDVLSGRLSSSEWSDKKLMGYNASFASDTDPMVLKVTVTAEDGTTVKEYQVTGEHDADKTKPVITAAETPFSARTTDTVRFTFSSTMRGRLYYLVDTDGTYSSAPNVATMKKKGVRYGEVSEIGDNTVTLSNIPSDFKGTIYFMLEGINQYNGDRIACELSLDPMLAGDINGDGLVNLSDAIALLDKVTAGEDVELFLGDINGDGIVNLSDAIALLDQVTADV